MPELVIRPYTEDDEDDVLHLLGVSLGKTVDDRYRGLFRWKHLDNPFGRSFIWLGHVEGCLAGVRSFLRWRFRGPDGEAVEAVRAVDTATHPDHRGHGVFRDLTLHGLDEMRGEGINLVFNTPNDQSRPANLTIGWSVEGRVPVRVRPRSLRSLWRMAGARTAAEVWSLDVSTGTAVDHVLDDVGEGPLRADDDRLITDRTKAFLTWRYAGCPSVASRAIRADDGVVLVRFRRRGGAVECTVSDILGTVAPRVAAAPCGTRCVRSVPTTRSPPRPTGSAAWCRRRASDRSRHDVR